MLASVNVAIITQITNTRPWYTRIPSFGHIPSCWIVASLAFLLFFEDLPTMICNGCINFHSQHYCASSLLSPSSALLLCFTFFLTVILVWCSDMLLCISLVLSNHEHFKNKPFGAKEMSQWVKYLMNKLEKSNLEF